MIKVTLKNGSIREFNKGITVLEAVKGISGALAREAVAAEVNGKTVGLGYKLNDDCELNVLTFDDKEGKAVYWHTTSHIMAQAVKRLFPGTKLAIGPAVDNGFYYDFDSETPFSAEDLNKIEDEMQSIIKEDLPIERFVLSRSEA